MLYRYEIQYWAYEQALELPFGLRCCSANGVLPEGIAPADDGSYSPDGRVEGKETRWRRI